MPPKDKYWKILCERQTTTLYETKVNIKILSEKNIFEFIRVLISKYALSDNEILEQHLRIPFKKSKDHIMIQRSNNRLGEPLSINFNSTNSGISVSVWFTD